MINLIAGLIFCPSKETALLMYLVGKEMYCKGQVWVNKESNNLLVMVDSLLVCNHLPEFQHHCTKYPDCIEGRMQNNPICFIKLHFRYQLINFLKNIFKEIAKHIIIICFLWRNLFRVWNKNKNIQFFLLTNCPQVLEIFYDRPVKYYFWRFKYIITRL